MSQPSSEPRDELLNAQQAAESLGISPSTLYSYVSRGLLPSYPHPTNARARCYRSADIHKLLQRKERRRNPATVAAGALDFGEPVLQSSITLIAGGQLYYRGHPALALATSVDFLQVAALIWLEDLHASLPSTQTLKALPPTPYLPDRSLNPLQKLQAALPTLQELDPAAHDQTRSNLARIGMELLTVLTAYACHEDRPNLARRSPVETLTAGWTLPHTRAAELLNAALILCTDHELNISSFTARCVASSGATAYAAVTAALSALQGPRHGGQSRRCIAFLREVAWDGPAAVRNRLQRGEDLPGFGHRLYPGGDPRGRLLVELALQVANDDTAALLEIAQYEVHRQTGQAPNLDFGLVSIAQALGLSTDAPLLLFALGRLVGWIGHIIEQTQSGALIRPRARYTGPSPQLE